MVHETIGGLIVFLLKIESIYNNSFQHFFSNIPKDFSSSRFDFGFSEFQNVSILLVVSIPMFHICGRCWTACGCSVLLLLM